jgi:hypothetical protein
MSTIIEQLKAYLDSEEGKAYIKRQQELATCRTNLMCKYMDYLHNLSIDERYILFSKIKAKYDSDEYYYRWINRGIEPPNNLYYYILQYGYIYGKTNEIEDAYFMYDSYIIDNSWIITAWYGQGTAFTLRKIEELNIT